VIWFVMKIKRKKGFFSISAVAEMFSVHQQTIRLYEKEGLITPKRSTGNTRLFSEEDIDRLEEVIHLTHELGINLAGVDMILKLKKQIRKMQTDMNKLFKQTHDQLDQHSDIAKQLISARAQKLLELKRAQTQNTQSSWQPSTTTSAPDTHQEQSDTNSPDNWEIEYGD